MGRGCEIKQIIVTRWELENFNPAFADYRIDDPNIPQELDFQRREFITRRLETSGFDISENIESRVDTTGSQYYFQQPKEPTQ